MTRYEYMMQKMTVEEMASFIAGGRNRVYGVYGGKKVVTAYTGKAR